LQKIARPGCEVEIRRESSFQVDEEIEIVVIKEEADESGPVDPAGRQFWRSIRTHGICMDIRSPPRKAWERHAKGQNDWAALSSGVTVPLILAIRRVDCLISTQVDRKTSVSGTQRQPLSTFMPALLSNYGKLDLFRLGKAAAAFLPRKSKMSALRGFSLANGSPQLQFLNRTLRFTQLA
jgi:hypothetical protein